MPYQQPFTVTKTFEPKTRRKRQSKWHDLIKKCLELQPDSDECYTFTLKDNLAGSAKQALRNYVVSRRPDIDFYFQVTIPVGSHNILKVWKKSWSPNNK